ncbi:MAG: PSD1 and planctomycete cytochrome C domain-containing protein [Planctomycetaceae bacterium]
MSLPTSNIHGLVAALLLLAVTATAQGDEQPLTFEQQVAPILDRHCFRCHGSEQREAGLDLRRRFTIVEGGDSGPAIVAGRPEQSLLIQLIDDGAMPPEGEPRLSDEDADVIRQWVHSGAETAGKTEPPLSDAGDFEAGFSEGERNHWAFQPVPEVTPPEVPNTSWVNTPVDAFVLEKLWKHGWQPAPKASKATLIRRVYFDLIGLPPTPQEVAAFENDTSSTAWQDVVDRLLASPHYGEKWAQHWLDVVRFAETEGFEYDRHLPDAWRYRDYVIDSLNDDKPFDQFVTEQIAGDELSTDNLQYQAAAVFHRLGAVRRNAGNPDIALSRNEVLTERTNIIGEAFLGLTVGCARCHNHQLEPITQKDYYRLQAYLAATEEHNIMLIPDTEAQAWNDETIAINKQIKMLREAAELTDGEEKQRLEQQVRSLTATLPPNPPTIPGIRNDFQNRTSIHVLRRGIWEHKGVAVGPRPLSILVSASMPELPADEPLPRTRLAEWITDSEHPLTSRVVVNRLWQHHFGTGLVKTANDLGTHGEPPSHPELLDWLAGTLVKGGWQWKPIHRLIVLSSAYQQASRLPHEADTAARTAVDPENRLLWKFSRRRLSAEELRDAMLAVSGRINLKAGGPSVMPPVDPVLVDLLYNPSQWKVADDPSEHCRRSIYLIAKRNLRLPFMEAFDAPALQTSCPARESSTHAPQALELLNGAFANQTAAAFADRLVRECGDDHAAVVDRAFRLAIGRGPTAAERQLSREFLRDQSIDEFALAILNLNGFAYVD